MKADIFTVNTIYSLCIFLCLLSMYISIRKIFKVKKPRIVSVLIMFFTCIIMSFSIYYIDNLAAVYVLSLFLTALVFGFCFKFSLSQCIFIGCYYVFHVIAFKGIVLGVMSLLYKQNIFMILNSPSYNLISIIFTQSLLFITFIFYITIMKVQYIRGFLINRKQLNHVLSIHTVILLFMIFNTFTYYYNLDLVWISIAQIMVSIVLYVIYIVVFNYGAHVADLLQHKIRDQKQLETIQSQLRQQNSLMRITDTVNEFKHGYREQLLTIEEYIDTKQYDKAISELKKDCLFQLDKLPHSKKYSNNIIINSLLIDRQEICDEKNIKLEAIIYYPLDLSVTERELHELLRIVSDNAIEANEKVVEDDRYINISSTLEKKWLNILIENPYEGLIIFDGDRPVSSFEREDNNGMGLIYIEELLEKQGGIIRYENDKKNKIFREHVLIRIND